MEDRSPAGVDPDVLMTAHGIGNSINWVFSHGSDHWQAASHVRVLRIYLCAVAGRQ